jgi:hypothetical protein
MKNKKSAAGSSIFALWEKASKSKKINETATLKLKDEDVINLFQQGDR